VTDVYVTPDSGADVYITDANGSKDTRPIDINTEECKCDETYGCDPDCECDPECQDGVNGGVTESGCSCSVIN
jgi:hypothetical protein